jgi:membrane protein
MNIPGLGRLSPMELLKRSVKEFFDDDMLTYASAISFQALFSLFPFVLFLTALLGFLRLPRFFDWLQAIALSMVPAQAAGVVRDVIEGLQEQKAGLLSFGVVFALWTASAGVRMVMKATNAAYGIGEGRPPWKRYPVSVIYTVGVAAMIIASAALLLLGPSAMEWIAGQLGLRDAFVAVWAWLRWPVAFVILTLAVAVTLHAAPNVEHRFKLVTPGALLAVVAWVAVSLGFKFYVNNFGNYNAMYGSIGAIIVLLLYFFISAAVLLFGAEINAVIENSERPPREREPARRHVQ